jgi:hypothetical protein
MFILYQNLYAMFTVLYLSKLKTGNNSNVLLHGNEKKSWMCPYNGILIISKVEPTIGVHKNLDESQRHCFE